MKEAESFDIYLDALFNKIKLSGVEVTEGAREVFRCVLIYQVRDGLFETESVQIDFISKIRSDDISSLYTLKYSSQRLTCNRAVRFLADIHEIWLFHKWNALAPASEDINE